MGDSKTYPALMVCVYVDDGKPQEMISIFIHIKVKRKSEKEDASDVCEAN